MIQLIINDMPVAVEPGTTVLEAARQHGFAIPTLCYLKAMRPNQACRLCVVEVKGPALPKGIFSSCDLPAADGLVVQTDTPRLAAIRATILEMLVASMPENPAIRKLAEQYGATGTRFALAQRDNCLLCGICVQACREKIGASALSLAALAEGTPKVAETVRLDSDRCVGCGTCANLCPVGVIRVEDKGAVRELSLYGTVVNTLDLVPCAVCGDHFTTGRVVELLKERLAADGLDMQAGLCPKCARETNPPPPTAYVRTQTGETA